MRAEHVTTQNKNGACNNWSNEPYITITAVRPLFTVIAATPGITAECRQLQVQLLTYNKPWPADMKLFFSYLAVNKNILFIGRTSYATA